MADGWLILADDLSGAAEVAAIAAATGLSAMVASRSAAACAAEVVVVDLDARLCAAGEAAVRVRDCLAKHGHAGRRVALKIDSALRGPVRELLVSAMHETGLARAVLLPANPATGRLVSGGRISVHGIPLHRTAFASDPSHPARSDAVTDLLGIQGLPPWLELGDAIDQLGLERALKQVDETALLAGSAGIFRALFPSRSPVHGLMIRGPALLVHGSAAGKVELGPDWGAPRCPTHPPLDSWHADLVRDISARGRLILSAPQQRMSDPTALLDTLAEAVAHVAEHVRPLQLFATGGSTAAAIAKRLDWRLMVAGAAGPGQPVRLATGDPRVPEFVVKPGSYAWPDRLFDGNPDDHLPFASESELIAPTSA